jgi:hypothetical protein
MKKLFAVFERTTPAVSWVFIYHIAGSGANGKT